MTTSSPERAQSSQWRNLARNSVAATFIFRPYQWKRNVQKRFFDLYIMPGDESSLRAQSGRAGTLPPV